MAPSGRAVPWLFNGGFHKWEIPNSWMVYFMENHMKIRMIWRYTHFRKPPYGLMQAGSSSIQQPRTLLAYHDNWLKTYSSSQIHSAIWISTKQICKKHDVCTSVGPNAVDPSVHLMLKNNSGCFRVPPNYWFRCKNVTLTRTARRSPFQEPSCAVNVSGAPSRGRLGGRRVDPATSEPNGMMQSQEAVYW